MYTISRDSAIDNPEYNAYLVYEKEVTIAIIITSNHGGLETLDEIHTLSPTCDIAKVIECVKEKGFAVSAYFVVEFPSLKYYRVD